MYICNAEHKDPFCTSQNHSRQYSYIILLTGVRCILNFNFLQCLKAYRYIDPHSEYLGLELGLQVTKSLKRGTIHILCSRF